MVPVTPSHSLPRDFRASTTEDATTRTKAARVIRAIVEKVVVYPEEERDEVRVELDSRFADLFNATRGKTEGRSAFVPRIRSLMVAVDGFEPPTKGL